jgi:hypothetical protein
MVVRGKIEGVLKIDELQRGERQDVLRREERQGTILTALPVIAGMLQAIALQ